MKACIIQPAYSLDYSLSDERFRREIAFLDACDPSMDLIVMPESTDIPCYAATQEARVASVEKYNGPLLEKAAETARRCDAVVFINARFPGEKGLVNTTYAFNRQGELAGTYFKQHTTPGECAFPELDSDYTFEFSEPTVIEIDGVRYGFLVCYDFYFYEYYAAMARQNLDVIIGCSHQRTDSHAATETTCKFLAYNTNAYVVRASVSMDVNSDIGGGSMIVTPEGRVLANLRSEVGMASAEFDPKKKFMKPAGFGGRMAAHYEYIEDGRRPWKYRPAGSAIVRPDALMPYPRVCAHRGFNTIAPENSMPAFGAAVAMGAEEIEFDLWPTKDGEIISLHDATLDRVSDGNGKVWDYTYEELLKLDFGVKHGPEFTGMKILTFEEILKKLACHVIMNIHIKTRDNVSPYDEGLLAKIIGLIEKYDCRKYCYFMTSNDTLMRRIGEKYPGFLRCVGEGDVHFTIVDRAIAMGCEKVQLFKPYFNQEMIDKAHAHGIRCNVFWSDDPEETRRFLDMGIDCILSNDYNRVANAVNAWKKEHEGG